jgi:hypothetical protein
VSEYDRPPPQDTHIRVRWDTYLALKRLTQDTSDSADMVIRAALKKSYPWLDL